MSVYEFPKLTSFNYCKYHAACEINTSRSLCRIVAKQKIDIKHQHKVNIDCSLMLATSSWLLTDAFADVAQRQNESSRDLPGKEQQMAHGAWTVDNTYDQQHMPRTEE